MGKAVDSFVEGLDQEAKGIMKELATAMDTDFETKLEESQSEVAKMKETFKSYGMNWDKATPEDVKLIKSLKEGGAVTEGTSEERLKSLGGMFAAYAGSKGSMQVAKELVKGWNENPAIINKSAVKDIEKAINTTNFAGGGAVVSDVYSNDFIMALRNQEFMSKLGIRRVNFTGGNYIIGKHNAGVTGAYVGETKKIKKDQQVFGNVTLTPKKAGVIVPIANEWIDNADAGAFENVTRDALNAMEELTGYTFLEGAGTQHTPKGLSKLANAGNKTASAGTTVANIIADLLYGRKQLTANKINIRKAGLILNPAQVTYLMGLRDADGWVFKDEMMTGKLFGTPYHETTAAISTKMYYADFDKIYEASSKGLIMSQSDSATFTNAAGEEVNSFEQDMSVMRLILNHDFGTQYDRAIAIVNSISWGN